MKKTHPQESMKYMLVEVNILLLYSGIKPNFYRFF